LQCGRQLSTITASTSAAAVHTPLAWAASIAVYAPSASASPATVHTTYTSTRACETGREMHHQDRCELHYEKLQQKDGSDRVQVQGWQLDPQTVLVQKRLLSAKGQVCEI